MYSLFGLDVRLLAVLHLPAHNMQNAYLPFVCVFVDLIGLVYLPWGAIVL